MDRPKRAPPKPPASAYNLSRILSSHSPILQSDLHTFLHYCITTWSTSYTEPEKRSLISTFPPVYRVYEADEHGKLKCPLSAEFVKNDSFLKNGLERFKREVGEGYYDNQWRKEAGKAVGERADGKFDEYLRERIEEEFEQMKNEEENEETNESSKEGEQGKAEGRKSKGRARSVRTKATRGELQMEMEMKDEGGSKMDMMESALCS